MTGNRLITVAEFDQDLARICEIINRTPMLPNTITINGQQLSYAETETLRGAVTAFYDEMSDPLHLGDDEHGRTMVAAYRRNCEQILRLLGVIG
jgi:hypothetical protein